MGVQLAVFLENKPGKLEAITKILSEEGINIRGIAMASEGEFGVLKVLVNDPARAHEVLKSHHFTVSERNVVVAIVEDRPPYESWRARPDALGMARATTGSLRRSVPSCHSWWR